MNGSLTPHLGQRLAAGALVAVAALLWTLSISSTITSARSSADTECDFNGDGYEDLAIGVGWEDIGATENSGAVQVVYGSASGLDAMGNQLWHQNSAGVRGVNEYKDHLGLNSLACGDFNGDDVDDLAIGVPGEDLGDTSNAGAVQVLFGSGLGLTAEGNQWWDQDSTGIRGVAEIGDLFGDAMVTGDFDGDDIDDLAIGVPGEDLGPTEDTGAVQVLFGSGLGLTAEGNQWWDQNTPDADGAEPGGILGRNEFRDFFGQSLSAGDFDGDGVDDLAVGRGREDIWNVSPSDDVESGQHGAVQVIFGSASGLTAAGNQWWDQDSPGIQGLAEVSDYFGRTVVAGDFDGDHIDDLAIGVLFEDVGATENAGAVQVIFGSASGLSADGNQWWDQNAPGIQGQGEYQDFFGKSLSAGDFDGDGVDDLAIGVSEGVGGIDNAGAVQVIFGSASGLSADGNQWWDQNSPGILGAPEIRDYFGDSMAAGDFDGNDIVDLGIAVDEGVGEVQRAGAVQVLYGSTSGPTAVGSQWWDQDSPGILGVVESRDEFGSTLSR